MKIPTAVLVLVLVPLAASLVALADEPVNAPAVPAGSLIMTKVVPFKIDDPIRLDVAVGTLRVPELRITRDDGSILDDLLPPRGGQSRFSFLRYAVSAENPSRQNWTLAVRVRLLDRNGAVVDEFEFRRTIGDGRARVIDLKRLTLNYAVPLIDRAEITLSAER
jgi:hypothetical protein